MKLIAAMFFATTTLIARPTPTVGTFAWKQGIMAQIQMLYRQIEILQREQIELNSVRRSVDGAVKGNFRENVETKN